jgi:hypothetical protein
MIIPTGKLPAMLQFSFKHILSSQFKLEDGSKTTNL